MSLVIELEREGRKAGQVCAPSYRKGRGCPLIVRQTSEDVLTANVFGILRRLRPELWLEPMMRTAFPRAPLDCAGTKPEVGFWTPVAPPPERAHDEGSTEVDVQVRWGETSLWIESKYRAELSPGTAADATRDQLIRLLDVAFAHDIEGQLFRREPFVLVLAMPDREPELVSRYRKPVAIREALSRRCRRPLFAEAEFLSRHLGYLSWCTLATLLDSAPSENDLERSLLDDVSAYIRRRRATLPLLGSRAA